MTHILVDNLRTFYANLPVARWRSNPVNLRIDRQKIQKFQNAISPSVFELDTQSKWQNCSPRPDLADCCENFQNFVAAKMRKPKNFRSSLKSPTTSGKIFCELYLGNRILLVFSNASPIGRRGLRWGRVKIRKFCVVFDAFPSSKTSFLSKFAKKWCFSRNRQAATIIKANISTSSSKKFNEYEKSLF
jgi:hypothetical protein